MKSIIYETPGDSDVDVVATLAIAAGDVQGIAGVYANARRSMRQRCEACITFGVAVSSICCNTSF